MEEHTHTLILTDAELNILNTIVRQSKVSATAEEIILLRQGKSTSPLLDLVYRIATLWEERLTKPVDETKIN